MARPQDGIEIWVEPDRFVKQADGWWYVYLNHDDFADVPRETLAYWYARGDRDLSVEVPIVVKTKGKSKVPEGTDVRMVMPNKEVESLRNMLPMPTKGQHLIWPEGLRGMTAKSHRGVYDHATGYPGDVPMGAAMDVVHGALPIPKRPGVSVNSRTLRQPFGRIGPVQPVLSDELMFAKDAHLPSVPTKVGRAITDALRVSRAFVFDEAASYRVGEICAYEPDLIADSQEFARCPYPKTWIELDAGAVMRAMIDAGLDVHINADQPFDDRLGFLFTDKGIYTAYSSNTEGAAWSPLAYRPHQPMTRDQEDRFCRDFAASRVALDRFLWGNAYDVLDPSRRRILRASHGLDILIPDGHFKEPGRLAPLLQGGGAGDLKVALCAALLLIRPNMLVTKETREPGRKLHLGRPTTFIAHRVVTVKLSPDRLVRRIRAAVKEERGRSPHRWHEVRGHYCHNHKAKVAHCVHDWEEVEPLRWQCRNGCGGKRSWRTYPEGKGDASIGVVTKHYHVKP